MNWYWPWMASDICQTALSCEVCQQAKHSAGVTSSNRQQLYAGQPWQRLAVNLVGSLPQTVKGNIRILVSTDHFTQGSDAIAIPHGTAPIIACVLDKRIFSYFGLRKKIHTDQGSQFELTYSKSFVDSERLTSLERRLTRL